MSPNESLSMTQLVANAAEKAGLLEGFKIHSIAQSIG
jgi:hypothetical protein